MTIWSKFVDPSKISDIKFQNIHTTTDKTTSQTDLSKLISNAKIDLLLNDPEIYLNSKLINPLTLQKSIRNEVKHTNRKDTRMTLVQVAISHVPA